MTCKGEDLANIVEAYECRLHAERMVDYAALLELATERLRTDFKCLPADVLLLVPEDLSRTVIETRMLECVAIHHRRELAVDQPAHPAHCVPAASDRELLPRLWHGPEAPQPLSDGTVWLVRAVGERLQWTPHELTDGAAVLQNLCQLVADSLFVATNDYEKDCTYCDYKGICGDVETLSATVNRMLECPDNRMLESFRTLRS